MGGDKRNGVYLDCSLFIEYRIASCLAMTLEYSALRLVFQLNSTLIPNH